MLSLFCKREDYTVSRDVLSGDAEHVAGPGPGGNQWNIDDCAERAEHTDHPGRVGHTWRADRARASSSCGMTSSTQVHLDCSYGCDKSVWSYLDR